jgi:hypothetical protein
MCAYLAPKRLEELAHTLIRPRKPACIGVLDVRPARFGGTWLRVVFEDGLARSVGRAPRTAARSITSSASSVRPAVRSERAHERATSVASPLPSTLQLFDRDADAAEERDGPHYCL